MTGKDTKEGRKSFIQRFEDGEDVYTVDEGDGGSSVVACPPHPLYGGNRNDGRVRETGKVLSEKNISCLRFDYGEWDEGDGETQDVVEAVRHAKQNWDEVGLFGYSFGSLVATKAVMNEGVDVRCLGLLSPPDEVADLLNDETAVYVIAGKRDNTLDSSRVIEKMDNSEWMSADHFFVGQERKVAEKFGEFFENHL